MGNLTLKKNRYGLLSDGSKVHLYTVSNGRMSFSVSDYGCTITSILLPSNNGKSVDVLLGYDSLDGYLTHDGCYGTIVGRFANRIGNASFTLDGEKYSLDKNDGGNCLHGGFDRWERKVWKAKEVYTENGLGIEFTRLSPDGEQGMPGNVKISVTYLLNDENVLTLDYRAVTDKATPINMTNHSYFNLKGVYGGTVEDQILRMDCDKYLEIDSGLIPTGRQIDVEGTPFDFRKEKSIGQDLSKTNGGYDHCYCLANPSADGKLVKFAELKDPSSGRRMTVATTQPGVQLYTANTIKGIRGKDNIEFKNYGAVCIETQHYPDSPNKGDFPSTILRPGKEYHEVTQYSFEF